MKLILLGGPGTGKGTQAAMMKERYGVPHISTGDIFRDNIRRGTPLGVEVKECMEKGGLVPDSITVRMVRDRLLDKDCRNGYILDGFPRTIPQAKALDNMLEQMGTDMDFVLNFKLPDDDIVKRISGRRVCPECGRIYHIEHNPSPTDGYCSKCRTKLVYREDDNEETIRERLKNYHKESLPLVDYYAGKGKLRVIDGRGNIEEVFSRVLRVLGDG